MGVGGAAKSLTLELVGKDVSLGRVLDSSGNRIDAFQKKVEGSNRSLSLSQRAVTGAVGAITALASGLTYAITKAVAFDKAMRNVNSLTKANEQAFAGMEKQVISMSTKLPQSATTLAEGLYDIASSGFQGADGIKVLDAAARSASAGLTTTAVSSRAITAVLNAYGLQAKDAADVSDVLFSTVNLGVISFDELANNLGDVVGATAAAKVGIDQVGAAIATMTLSGIKGAQATTALSSLTTKLVQPSAALAKVYEQLGYESGASALEAKGLRGVMEDLRIATGGNITTMLQLFPDIEAARGALALMANDGQNYNKVADQITDKTKRMGATQAVLDEQMKSVSAQWQLFVNHIDAAAISVGVKLLPSLTKGMDLVGDFATAVGMMAAEIKGRVASGLDDMGTSVDNIIDLLQNLGEAILPTAEALGKIAGGAVLTSFNLLASVLGDVSQLASENETVVMALGIAYAVHATGGVASLYAMLGKAGPAMGALSAAGSSAYDFIAGLFTPGVAGATDSVTKLGTAAKSAGSKMKAAFMAVAPAAAIAGVLTIAVSAWQSYSDGVKEAKDITKATEKAMNSFNVNELVNSINKAKDFTTELQDRIDTFNDAGGSGIDQIFNFNDNSKTLGMLNSLDRVQEKSDEAKAALGQLQYNTVELFKLLGKPLPDEAKWINDVQGANGAQAQATAMAQMDAVLTQLGPKLKAAGVDLTKGWDVQQMTNAYAALQSVKDGTDQTATAQHNLIEAMGVAATSMGDAESAADSLKSALDDLMGAAIGVDQAQINWSTSLDKLKTTLRDNGATLSFNTTKGRENRQAVIDQVESLQDMLVAGAKAGDGQDVLAGKLDTGREALIKAGVGAGFTKGEMVGLLAQYNLTPELVKTIIEESGAAPTKEKLKELAAEADALGKKNPKPKVSAETTVAQSRLNSVQQRLDQIDGRNASASVSITENTYKNLVETHTVKPVGVLAPGNTGLNGGFYTDSYADGNLPTQAKIQRAKGPYGLIQWAEPGTGDEAFIPMSPNKRGRSTEILSKVADDFGYMLVEAYASGGFRYPAFKYNAKRGPKAEQYRDWQAARYAAETEYKDRARVAAIAAGRSGAGMVQYGGSVGDTLGSFGSALEARAQASADLSARKSRNPTDTAEDYYRKPTASLKQYLAVLKQAETYQRQWNATLTKLSSTVGSDVVESLKDMGETGEAIIRQMAKSSVADMKKMGDQIRRLNFAKFVQDTASDVKGHAQFQANLQALVKMGRADLASRFEEMGYDQAAGLAATAVTAKGSSLTSLNNLLAQQEQYNSPDNGSALKLASLIQRSGGKLGVVGLANASGMPVGDVLGLLGRFEGSVFSKIPAAAMRGIRSDQALLKAGKQPSGHAMGTIIRGSDTGYYYGEPDSGGESLIPHGIDRRQRAMELWKQTGRILGVSIPAGTSGGGAVIVAAGAVTVTIPVSQPGATPAEIEAVAKRAVGQGMSQLVRQINHGGSR